MNIGLYIYMGLYERMLFYLHLQNSCRIPHLPSIPYGQSIIGYLQVKLFKVDLDNLKFINKKSSMSVSSNFTLNSVEVNRLLLYLNIGKSDLLNS